MADLAKHGLSPALDGSPEALAKSRRAAEQALDAAKEVKAQCLLLHLERALGELPFGSKLAFELGHRFAVKIAPIAAAEPRPGYLDEIEDSLAGCRAEAMDYVRRCSGGSMVAEFSVPGDLHGLGERLLGRDGLAAWRAERERLALERSTPGAAAAPRISGPPAPKEARAIDAGWMPDPVDAIDAQAQLDRLDAIERAASAARRQLALAMLEAELARVGARAVAIWSGFPKRGEQRAVQGFELELEGGRRVASSWDGGWRDGVIKDREVVELGRAFDRILRGEAVGRLHYEREPMRPTSEFMERLGATLLGTEPWRAWTARREAARIAEGIDGPRASASAPRRL